MNIADVQKTHPDTGVTYNI